MNKNKEEGRNFFYTTNIKYITNQSLGNVKLRNGYKSVSSLFRFLSLDFIKFFKTSSGSFDDKFSRGKERRECLEF